MSKTEMEALFAGLAGEGTTEARGVGFTLESAKAREKLQEFAMAQPENFQLLAIAGLYALGCRHFQLTIDADDFRVQADKALSRQPFENLWSFVSSGSSDPVVIGCRLIAMAILTSVRLDEMEWRLESHDDKGPWQLMARVKKGTLGDLEPKPKGGEEVKAPGLTLWVKRKALSQIARRFVARWWSGEAKGADEELLRERLFLPREASLECNGRSLTPLEPPSDGVLGVLQTGQAPSLVQCPATHHLTRDYSLTVVLCHPSSVNDARLPGRSNHTQWIWNGLRMDSTILGGELENFRAFVWATELRPDLSFTSLVDNRDKQALERTVRSMARELLDRFTRGLTAEIRAQRTPNPVPFVDRLSIVRDAVTRRIGGNVDWKRLASLNRGLTECPIVVGSGPDGAVTWFSLAEIREELVQGRQVAIFSGDYQSYELAVWADRPLVLFTSKPERDFLKARLSQFTFLDGATVASQLNQLLRPKSRETAPQPSSPVLAGAVRVDQLSLSWALYGGDVRSLEPGSLAVQRSDGREFVDRSLSLPAGLRAELQADLAQSYAGGLLDHALAQRLRQAILESIIEELARRDGPVSRDDYDIAARILALPEPLAPTGQGASWLIVSSLSVQRRRVSPNALREELEAERIPLYVAPWAVDLRAPSSARLARAPVVLVPAEAEAGLAQLIGQPVHNAQAFEMLCQRKAPDWNSDSLLWQATLDDHETQAISPALRSVTLGIAPHVEKAHRTARVLTSLEGHYMAATASRNIYPYVRIAVDWAQGWPDEQAKTRLGEPDEDQVEEILRRACLALAPRFFAEATPQDIYAANQELVGTLMFDLLSEPATADTPCLLLADGRKISLREIPSQDGVVSCYATPPEFGRSYSQSAVYLPGPIMETISMLTDAIGGLEGEHKEDYSTRKLVVPQPTPGGPAAGQRDPSPAVEPEPVGPIPEPKAEPVSVPTSEPSLIDARKTAIVPDEPTQEAPVTPSPTATDDPKPAAPESSSGQQPTHSRELTPGEQLASDFDKIGGGDQQFRTFLLSCQLDPRQTDALRLSAFPLRPVLGNAALQALDTPAGRLLLLSALSSVFHREQGGDATQEQQFHARLLAVAQQLPPAPRR